MKTLQIKNGNRDWWQITIEYLGLDEDKDEYDCQNHEYLFILSKQEDSTGNWNPIYRSVIGYHASYGEEHYTSLLMQFLLEYQTEVNANVLHFMQLPYKSS